MLPALIYICGQPLDQAVENTPKEIKRNCQEATEAKAEQKEMRVVFNGTKVELPLSNNGSSADIKLVPPTTRPQEQEANNAVTTGATFV